MRIVAIRTVNYIGDALFVFPTLAALRAKYPQAHITLVTYRLALPLAQAWGLADEVFDSDYAQWQELFSPLGIRSPNMCALFKQVDCLIYWDIDVGGQVTRNMRALGVKDVFAAPEQPIPIGDMHIADFMAMAVGLQAIGIEHVVEQYTPPRWRNGADLCLFQPPIAVHPGSTDAKRRWPARSFAAVISELLRLKYPVLLLGGPAEVETLALVQQHISPRPEPGLLTVLENAPLLNVASQLQQCRFFLGNDSGIGHLAGLLGVPMLGIFGPTNPLHKRPTGPHVETTRALPLEILQPDTVLSHILARLSAARIDK